MYIYMLKLIILVLRSRDRRKRPPLLRSSAKFTGSSVLLSIDASPKSDSVLLSIDTSPQSDSTEHIYEETRICSSEEIYEDLKLLPVPPR